MNEFKTFIASSLRPEFLDHREKIVQALQTLNEDPDLQPLSFTSYRFESEGSNASCIGGIQNHINLDIAECHGFVLICDSNIGKKTVEEFEKALERFNKHLNPSFVIILKSKVSTPCGPNQITYEKFKSDYLTIFDYNHDGKINDDVIDYEFEFDNIDSACDKLKKDLKEWITNKNNRPLFKAELGRHITSEFLYTDKGRIKECTDQIYFRRHFDNMLDKAIREKEAAILIKGASLSGKTRALYQAIKNAPDTWFYKFKERHDKIKMAAEIEEIAEYLEFARSSMPICLIFDDVHQLSTCAEVVKAIDRLMDAINGKEVSIIMTSTSSDDSLIPATKSLKIKPLSRKECSEAVLFFRRFGKFVNSEYKEIGAMMIDLESMKRSYNLFKEDEDPLYSTSRTCLLEAIKASSIWHSSNIGNVSLLIDFTNYLLSLKPSMKEVDFHALTDKNILDLLKLPGINKDENTETIYLATEGSISQHILIEEYIYRYVLPHQTIEQEWRLINQILSFVNNSDTPPESLIVSLSKIARRAENHDAVVRTIYDLVMSIFLEDESKCPRIGGQRLSAMPWYNKLKEGINEIKREIEVNPTAENEDCSKDCIYMAKIIWSRMLLEETYEGAERMFNSVPYPLQNLPMLGVLIFKSSGNQEKLKALIQSRNLEKSFYIINKMIPHASDFDEALSYFQNGELPYESEWDYIDSATDMRQMVETREMQGEEWEELKIKDINRQQFILALNSLATKVRCFGDLEKLLDVIRSHYIYLLDDLEYAKNYLIAEDKYSIEKLTWIDLLSCLNFYCLRHAFTDIMTWGKQLPPDLPDLTGLIIQEYARTSELTTVGYKAKQVVCAIFNVFIEKCNECPYEDVLENVFKKMYVQKGDRMVNLCDSYTYSSMMRNRNCKYIDALDLYNNFIEPHSKARDGHFIITHFILNEILNKVRSVAEYNKINRIFIENNVAKDIYTYNVVLRNLTYSMGVTQILPQMYQDGIEVDIYTLGTLISKAPNIKVATSFFYPLRRIGIKSEDNMIPEGALHDMVEKKIKEYTHTLELEYQHFFWASLVEAHCRNEEDREVLKKVLEYLERPKNREKIFGVKDNGIIYNNCLKNRSFIRNYEEAEEFINSKKITADAYTLSHLIGIILDDYKGSAGYEQDIPNYLNKIYRNNKSLIIKEIKDDNSFIYNERLKAYKSHDDKLSFVFIYPDGKESEDALTPMEYIRNLAAHELPIDQYTLSCFADIPQGQTYGLLKEFLEFVKANNLCVNHYGIDFLVRNFQKTIPENERVTALSAIFELPLKDDFTSPSKAAVNMFTYGLCSLSEAFERVEGNDTEKLYRYTQLLSQFRKSLLSRKRTTDSKDFEESMKIYSKYVKGANIKPNVDIFSNLANFATNIEEMRTVLAEMGAEGIKPNSYILTPILRVSDNIDDIENLIQEYISLKGAEPGREGSETEVDAILRGLGIIWRRKRNEDADIHELATDLTEYILSSAPSSNALGHLPCFKIYKHEGNHLTQNALCELINFWPKLEDDSKVNEAYLDNTAKLLESYYRPDNDSIRLKLAHAINYVATKRDISSVDILMVLKPYPKLAFMFANEKPVDGYEAYRLLIESWIEGFDKISQDYAIDVLLTQLEQSKALSDIREDILVGIYRKWNTGLTTADFLTSGDTVLTKHIEITEYTECDRLRRKYLYSKYEWYLNRRRHTPEEKVNRYIYLFRDELTDASFIKSALGVFAKKNNLKFDDIKPILETVAGNKDCTEAVLCCMADMSVSYANLRYMTEVICSESVDVSEDLAQKLTFGILRKRYDDFKFGLIAGQILRAVGEDRLQINDLLYVPTSLPGENLLKRLRLSKETKALYKMLNSLSSEMIGLSSREMIEHAENLICQHYTKARESKSIIDSLVVQDFIRRHVLACNRRDDKEYESLLLEKVETIMSVPAENKADVSILFSEKAKNELNKKDFWYQVTPTYISKMIINPLNCSNERKLNMVISSRSQSFWWSNAFKGNFDKLMSFAEIVESRGDEARPVDYMNNLFNEAQKAEDFIKALKLILSGRMTDYNRNVIVESLLRIIGKDEDYAHRIVRYNSMLYNKYGRQATITSDHSTWIPDSGFFNYIFGDDTLDESSDPVLQNMFRNAALISPISRFVSEMMVMRELKKAVKEKGKTEALIRHISINSEYFNQGGKIDNDLLIATYIRYTRSESNIVKNLLDKSEYNVSMLSVCADRKGIFDDKVGYHVFRGLSEIVEMNYERGFSRITTQKIFHKLLYSCGNEFVLNNPQITIHVAETIRSVEEYRRFTEDLMKFYIPVSQELTAALIEKLNTLTSNDSWRWLLGVVRNRTKALAEYDQYHQGTDCHAFKAGFLLLLPEKRIDFCNFWAGQNLHLKNAETEETVEKILSQKFTDRVNAVMAVESISLRCEMILKMYVKNFDELNNKEKAVIWKKLDIIFEELANTLNGPDASKIHLNSIIRIFTTLTKKNIRMKKELNQSMLTGLINFYKLQRNNDALGYYYKNNTVFVLNRISEICDKVQDGEYIKIYYSLFTNNKVKYSEAYFMCGINTVKNALSD